MTLDVSSTHQVRFHAQEQLDNTNSTVFIVAFLFCFGVRGKEHGVGMIEKMGGFGRIQKIDKNIKNHIV